jgi:hypothetical protein
VLGNVVGDVTLEPHMRMTAVFENLDEHAALVHWTALTESEIEDRTVGRSSPSRQEE